MSDQTNFEQVKKPLGDSFTNGVIFMTSAGVLNAFLNYAFQIIAARHFGPAQFGLLNSCLAGAGILAVTAYPVRTVLVEQISQSKQASHQGIWVDQFAWRVIATTAGMFLLASMAVLLLSIPMTFNLFALVATFSFVIPMASSGLVTGRLQSRGRFRLLSLVGILYSLGKLVVGVSVIYATSNVSITVLAISITTLCITFCGLWLSRQASIESFSIPIGHTLKMTCIYLALFTILNGDLLVVRLVLPAQEAGEYSAAALLGKGVLLLGMAFAEVAYPRYVAHFTDKRSLTSVTTRSLQVIVPIGLFGAGLLSVIGTQVARTLFGSQYGDLGNLAALIAIQSIIHIVILLNVYALIVSKNGLLIFILPVYLCFVLLVSIFAAGSPIQLLGIGTSGAVLLTLALYREQLQ
jgi:O-antigen/teichoic acid export membrane protein